MEVAILKRNMLAVLAIFRVSLDMSFDFFGFDNGRVQLNFTPRKHHSS